MCIVHFVTEKEGETDLERRQLIWHVWQAKREVGKSYSGRRVRSGHEALGRSQVLGRVLSNNSMGKRKLRKQFLFRTSRFAYF